MQSDYMYMNDIIYVINEDIKVMFKTIASFNTNGNTYSNCTEFKLNGNKTCNTMIKRNISYYLFIDDRRGGKSEKICSKCAGELFYRIGIKNAGLLTSTFSGSLMNLNMKAFQ